MAFIRNSINIIKKIKKPMLTPIKTDKVPWEMGKAFVSYID